MRPGRAVARPAPAPGGRRRKRAGAVVSGVSLAAAALLGGCRTECVPRADEVPPDPDLSADMDYLASLRRAAETAHPGSGAQWERDRREYERFKAARLPEVARHPFVLRHPEWSDAARLGWDAWVHWTGGNQFTWRDLAQRSGGRLELLKLLDNRLLPRGERFARFGLVNDPETEPPARDASGACVADAFGLCLDRPAGPRSTPEMERAMGRPSGILGLRLFDNPDYRPGSWNAADPWRPPPGCAPGAREGKDPAATARESNADCYQPPYLVGLSCGFCHVSFHPERPPADPARPGWENLAPAFGNVYLKEGPLFAWMLDFGADAFYTHYLLAQPPGTSDTSRIATDDLDNPGAINGLVHVAARLALASPERLPHGGAEPVPHVLKDGADSVGLGLAALRVYVNIGMLGNYWLNQHDAYLLLGGAPRRQRPFRIARAMATAAYDGAFAWNQTELRLPELVAFFETLEPFKLERAPGGAARLAREAPLAERGKTVFADHCAACHSSKQPRADRGRDAAAWREEMRALVGRGDFLDGNFLSDDRRYPADRLGVNLTRSMATNALEGHVWQDFSSLTYKTLPSLGPLKLAHPFRRGETLSFCPPAGGRGYYRTASLSSLWATAPFFHNNSLGRHVHDPSVEGRLAAFEDAARQLLWPQRRTDPEGRVGPYVKRTGDTVTWLPLPDGMLVPLPPRYPVKALGNLPLHELAEKLPRPLASALRGGGDARRRARKERIVREVLGNDTLRGELRRVLLGLNAAPDFVENRGHERIVAAIASDEDKRALIAFMRTF